MLGRITLHHRAQGPHRRRLRGRGRRGVGGDQEADLPRARRDRLAGRDPGDQHLVAVGHRHLHRQRPARPGHRRALLQPGAGPGPRRDHPHRRHRGAGARRRQRAGPQGRQEPGRLRRQGRLHRQHPAVRLPQPRRLDVRGQVRLARGHRRRDALRLRLPDGPAAAARPDRSRHGATRSSRRCTARVATACTRRRRSSSRWSPRACWAARPAAASTPTRRPDSPKTVADDQTPSADDKPQLQHNIKTVGVVGTGTMASGIVEVFAKAGYDVLYVGRSQDKVDGVIAAITKNFDKQIQRGRATEDDKAAVLAKVTRHHVARRPQGRRHRRRGDRRGPRGQDHAVREPRRHLQAGRDPRHDDVLACRSSRWPRSPAARRTSSACTSSTRRR